MSLQTAFGSERLSRSSTYRGEEIRQTTDYRGIKRYSWRGSNWSHCSKSIVCDEIDRFRDNEDDWLTCSQCGAPLDPDEAIYPIDDENYPCHDGGCDDEFYNDWRAM